MWYYVENEAPTGPFTPEKIQALVAKGTLTSDTLVWKEGLPAWQPISEVRELQPAPIFAAKPDSAYQPASPFSAPEPSPFTIDPSLTTASLTTGVTAPLSSREPSVAASTYHLCCECGKQFSQNYMISLHRRWVCGSCKPIHLQKLREKFYEREGLSYAGFSSRLHSGYLDYIYQSLFVGFLFGVAYGITIPFLGHPSGNSDSAAFSLGLILIIVVIPSIIIFKFLYEAISIGRSGYTLGQKRFGLKVVNFDGSKLSFWKACYRTLINFLTYFLLGLGYLTAIWDFEKRSLTDVLCGTRVIYTRK